MRDREDKVESLWVMLAVVVAVLLAAILPRACEAMEYRAIGHLGSWHSNDSYEEPVCSANRTWHRQYVDTRTTCRQQAIDYNDANPGLGLMVSEGMWTAGVGYIARNSMRQESAYVLAGMRWKATEDVTLSALTGAISGYKMVERVECTGHGRKQTCEPKRGNGFRPVFATMVTYEPMGWAGVGANLIITPPYTPKGATVAHLALSYKF